MTWMIKRDPFQELRNLQDEMNRAFNLGVPRLFNGEEGLLRGQWIPNVDIREDEKAIYLEADLPGLKPEDFRLSIENYKLTLSGERKFEHEEKGDNYHRVERSYGSFTRSFTLPTTVSIDEVKADFKDGVLRISMPKREEVRAREIQVAIKGADEAVKSKAAEVK